jgi:hypothetical protein
MGIMRACFNELLSESMHFLTLLWAQELDTS